MDFVQAQDKNCTRNTKTYYEVDFVNIRIYTSSYDVRATYYNLNRKP